MSRSLAIDERYRGCLLGLAVGDALGAPLEWSSEADIQAEYGSEGLDDFAPSYHEPQGEFPAGSYTDDTQLALATASGCVEAELVFRENGVSDPGQIMWRRYREWYESQTDPRQRRGPGTTCLSALAGQADSRRRADNHSKGCGGVMRMAPVGLATRRGEAFHWGVEYARLTHGHPSGYLAAGFVADLTQRIVQGDALATALDKTTRVLLTWPGHEETLAALTRARELAAAGGKAARAIAALGQGWVAEEALAIAAYSVLRFPTDWSAAVLASVNHGGDSDSTGCVTGALAGALLGEPAIPEKWAQTVEDAAAITRLADDMCRLFGEGCGFA